MATGGIPVSWSKEAFLLMQRTGCTEAEAWAMVGTPAADAAIATVERQEAALERLRELSPECEQDEAA